MRILLVEDDETLTQVLTKSLEDQHYVVDAVPDGETGWTYGSTFDYDLIVLDVMLPKLDGIRLCQRFRAEAYATPILLLTAQDTSAAKIKGLDAGADDYVVKPFDVAELVARIRALLRRGSASAAPVLAWEHLRLNPSTCEVTYREQPLTLTAKEYELLELFLRDSQHVFSIDEILDNLWSSEEFPAEATVRSHIRRLRHKLTLAGAPDLIATVHGRGYYLKPSVAGERISEEVSQVNRQVNGEVNRETNNQVNRPERPSHQLDALASIPASQHPMEQQIKYREFLSQTWETTRPKSLEQVELVAESIQVACTENFTLHHRQRAIHAAHKLAGTLGIFDLETGMQLARQLEQLLEQPDLPVALLTVLTDALRQEILRTASIDLSQSDHKCNPVYSLIHSPGYNPEFTPLLLIVDDDPNFTQPLLQLAARRGIRTAIAPVASAARAWLIPSAVPFQKPDMILLRLLAVDSVDATERLTVLKEWAQQYPTLPVLGVGNLPNRPDYSFPPSASFRCLEQPDPESVLNAVTELLHNQPSQRKVLIVDDDQQWLDALPLLLRPWGFQLTTLSEPLHFWAILESVMPDLLILDVKMPQVSGLELCQVLRNQPHWCRLPVLFLTTLNQPQDQHRAFAVGADDYVCKPVTGVDLANRILNRLRRTQAWDNQLSLTG